MPPESWHEVSNRIVARVPNAKIHLAALSGYGERTSAGPNEEAMLHDLFAQAPPCAHWCGWSMGSLLAMSAALKRPERIASLCLVSPTPRFILNDTWKHGMPQRNFDRLCRLMQRDFTRGWRRFLELQQTGDSGSSWVDQTVAQFDEFWVDADTLQRGKTWLCETDLTASLSSIQIPTSIVAGVQDPVIPIEASREVHHAIANSAMREIGAGHALPLTHPEIIVEALSERIQADASTYLGSRQHGD